MYTPETSAVWREPLIDRTKNMWKKQLCIHKVWDFATGFWRHLAVNRRTATWNSFVSKKKKLNDVIYASGLQQIISKDQNATYKGERRAGRVEDMSIVCRFHVGLTKNNLFWHNSVLFLAFFKKVGEIHEFVHFISILAWFCINFCYFWTLKK